MTKGRVVPSMDVCVAEQEPFFITIDETEAHDASVEKQPGTS
jgi:hypothetical protein